MTLKAAETHSRAKLGSKFEQNQLCSKFDHILLKFVDFYKKYGFLFKFISSLIDVDDQVELWWTDEPKRLSLNNEQEEFSFADFWAWKIVINFGARIIVAYFWACLIYNWSEILL